MSSEEKTPPKLQKQPFILIIDDNPVVRATLEKRLGVHDYQVETAADGSEGLARLEAGTPDLILLDADMPGLSGFDLCRRLKNDAERQHIPIILLMPSSRKTVLKKGLDAGADEFLAKPVNEIKLQARVRAMLRTKRQYDEIQATLHLREDMVQMILHDLRNMLAVMGLHNELMLNRNQLSSKDSISAQVIRTQIRRMESFTNDMLLAAKMDEGELILKRTLVDFNSVVTPLIEAYEAMAATARIELVVELPAVAPQLLLDANLLGRVIDNLMSNAFKFSPAGSKVTLRITYPQHAPDAAEDAPAVRIQVLDEGMGIPESEKERIFDKFAVVKSDEPVVAQIGLGLAFCEMVVTAHGGRIFVEDNVAHGAIFTVEI